ncbi:MAG: hypothetical protein OEY89_03405 [Gammaproteobacteria bacterium]|nr:hypothetical protein [Gammaproteobacteria bacterium]
MIRQVTADPTTDQLSIATHEEGRTQDNIHCTRALGVDKLTGK